MKNVIGIVVGAAVGMIATYWSVRKIEEYAYYSGYRKGWCDKVLNKDFDVDKAYKEYCKIIKDWKSPLYFLSDNSQKLQTL